MRYCLVVEHSWETSGHVDSRERVHTALQTREHIYEVITTPRKKSLCPMCPSVSFFTSLPFPVSFPTDSPIFLSHFFQLLLCVGLLVKGLGVLGLQTFGQRHCVVRLMSWERATGLYRQPLTGQP